MKTIRMVSAAFLVCTLTGCVAVALVAGGAAAGAGAVIWHEGTLRTTIGDPISDVREASTVVLKRSGNGVVSDHQEDIDTRRLETKLGSDDTATIKLHAVSSSATEITIRIGFFGDRQRSEEILRQIEERLSGPRVTP